jgi:hypothetical protein
MRQRGFSQSRRTVEEDMFVRFAALSGGGDGQTQFVDQRLLADIVVQHLRPQRSETPFLFLVDFLRSNQSFPFHGVTASASIEKMTATISSTDLISGLVFSAFLIMTSISAGLYCS